MSEWASRKTLARRVSRHRAAVAGAAVVVLVLLVAIFAPLLAPFDPGVQALDSGLSGPSWSHWLGQDRLGRDMLSRLVHGARISVAVGLGT
ncbi:MAG: ABC transporter permease, partial [Deltaproteobacteria bacterium]|nr:ABC transporter permease [Deltaproteobacteria bacterium]